MIIIMYHTFYSLHIDNLLLSCFGRFTSIIQGKSIMSVKLGKAHSTKYHIEMHYRCEIHCIFLLYNSIRLLNYNNKLDEL